jgi:ABC-type transport system involved in cytochrome bd biosynthesis fused ATPase/permease subunit
VFAADNVDDEFLYECLKKAGANEFVQNMGGLYATLSEAGRSLSGGEKRRIGIARSLTKRPDILILDEVTAGLDEEKKYELVKTIKTLADTMVVIIITHDIEIAMLGSENVYICSDGSV